MDLSLSRRRELRHDSTDAERLLWFQLRAKRFLSFKFRRQHPCGPYILDFFCHARQLAIELDGGQHFESNALDYDQRRTVFLERAGVKVLRFTNDVVMKDTEAVLEAIWRALSGGPSP
jgi:very-short-patch-repair endonuclease